MRNVSLHTKIFLFWVVFLIVWGNLLSWFFRVIPAWGLYKITNSQNDLVVFYISLFCTLFYLFIFPLLFWLKSLPEVKGGLLLMAISFSFLSYFSSMPLSPWPFLSSVAFGAITWIAGEKFRKAKNGIGR